jgi:hypothetical protein
MAIIISILTSTFWTIGILFCWPIFPIDSSVLNCTVDMVKRTTVMSYKIIIIIFVFIIPIALLVFTNVRILLLVRYFNNYKVLIYL